MELRLASVDSLSPFSEPFDKIFAINSIGFWKDPVDCLRSLRNHLEPGGVLALTVQPRGRNASPDSARELLDRLARRVSDAGFDEPRKHLLELPGVPAATVIAPP